MRETYAAMGGISEMLPSAQSSFVRILMVLHESSGLCFLDIRDRRVLQRIRFLSWLEEAHRLRRLTLAFGRCHRKTEFFWNWPRALRALPFAVVRTACPRAAPTCYMARFGEIDQRPCDVL